jgi:type 2 lantibiotic biosynthesis protein LanM
MENFIANGANPVPVDFEMIFQGIRQRPRAMDDDTEAQWLAAHLLEKSVQSVGMLPAYVEGQDGTLISMGALEPSIYPVKLLRWEAINTPQMLLESVTERIEINVNLPMLNEQPIDVARYRDDFLVGFTDTMRFIASHAQAVLAAVEKVDFSRITIRKVVRPTRFYYMLLKRLYDHRHMDDSVLWSLEADFVARFYDWEDEAERPWKLAASERQQMLELGIPHFTMLPDSNIISDGRSPVTRLHVVLGSEVVRTRLAQLNAEAMQEQCDIIRACLQLPLAQPPAKAKAVPGVSFAQALRNMLMHNSIQAERSITWIGLTRIDHQVAAQLAPLGYDLYLGTTGIAIFLAALAQTGCSSASDDCRKVLGATIKAVQSPKFGQLNRGIGIGGAVGVGSIVYGLTLVGELLCDAKILEAAESCARGISPESIQKDTKFDLIAGVAGACMALLALHKRIGADWLIERAIMCGDHLLAHRDAGSGMWVSPVFEEPLTGVAHGAAGFALAFSRLYGITGHSRFSLAAQDCIAFEQVHFDETLGNWIDLRSMKARGTAKAPNQWCYGAVGIGMARLSMLEDGAVSANVLTRDIDRALAATLSDKGGRNSSLCCGDAGHIEFLVDAAGKLQRPALMAAGQKRSEEVLDTWSRTGDLIWNGGWAVSNPGFFQGLAGVGFSALRAAGVNLPSPLIWA